jgi:succinate dehydrogenase / fumarate reductase cytochrome b subunit
LFLLLAYSVQRAPDQQAGFAAMFTGAAWIRKAGPEECAVLRSRSERSNAVSAANTGHYGFGRCRTAPSCANVPDHGQRNDHRRSGNEEVNRLVRLFRTSIGSKLVVAASGLLLLAFLFVHAGGNLLILKGPEALNGYADWMQGHPMLWGFRIGLLGLFGIHVATAIRLARANRRARPLLHLTLRAIGPGVQPLFDAAGRVDVYGIVVASFHDPLIAAVYLLAMALLGLHLVHAIESLFQTLGFHHESYEALIRILAPALTLLIVGSFAAVPLLVLAGSLTGTG